MKIILLLLSALTFVGSLPASAQEAVVPQIQPKPLSADRLGMYRSFLFTWNDGSKAPLNIADITEPFSPNDGDVEGCLKGFRKTHTTRVHHLPSAPFEGLNVRLVDPRLHEKRDPWDAIRNGESVDSAVDAGFAAGIFTFSEIIFNPAHTRAAFTYSFVCGGLCGNGGTVLYKRQNSTWVRLKTRCSGWVS